MFRGTNAEVVREWYRGHSYSGSTWSGNLFFDGDMIFSYGAHFPLAVRLHTSNGVFYLCNGDKYSVTTSQHQALVFQEIPNRLRVEIPFSALRLALNVARRDEWELNDFEGIEVIANERDKYIDTGRISKKTGKPIYRHVLGGCLFSIERDGVKRFFISSIDPSGANGGLYFLTELHATDIKTLDEAYESMKPIAVKLAEEEEKSVFRQGEWFFIEEDAEAKAILDTLELQPNKDFVLKRIAEDNGHHIASEGFEFEGKLYVRGVVKHRWREHKQLKLYETGTKPKDRKWHRAYPNIQLGSWGASGAVD